MAKGLKIIGLLYLPNFVRQRRAQYKLGKISVPAHLNFLLDCVFTYRHHLLPSDWHAAMDITLSRSEYNGSYHRTDGHHRADGDRVKNK